jgi:hypothetical protein
MLEFVICQSNNLRDGMKASLKVKVKVHPRTSHEGPEGEQRYSSTLSLNMVLDWVGVQCHTLTALPQGKRPCTHCTGGRVGPWTHLDWCRKSHPHLD